MTDSIIITHADALIIDTLFCYPLLQAVSVARRNPDVVESGLNTRLKKLSDRGLLISDRSPRPKYLVSETGAQAYLRFFYNFSWVDREGLKSRVDDVLTSQAATRNRLK